MIDLISALDRVVGVLIQVDRRPMTYSPAGDPRRVHGSCLARPTWTTRPGVTRTTTRAAILIPQVLVNGAPPWEAPVRLVHHCVPTLTVPMREHVFAI